eukprot:gene22489-biopygen2740
MCAYTRAHTRTPHHTAPPHAHIHAAKRCAPWRAGRTPCKLRSYQRGAGAGPALLEQPPPAKTCTPGDRGVSGKVPAGAAAAAAGRSAGGYSAEAERCAEAERLRPSANKRRVHTTASVRLHQGVGRVGGGSRGEWRLGRELLHFVMVMLKGQLCTKKCEQRCQLVDAKKYQLFVAPVTSENAVKLSPSRGGRDQLRARRGMNRELMQTATPARGGRAAIHSVFTVVAEVTDRRRCHFRTTSPSPVSFPRHITVAGVISASHHRRRCNFRTTSPSPVSFPHHTTVAGVISAPHHRRRCHFRITSPSPVSFPRHITVAGVISAPHHRRRCHFRTTSPSPVSFPRH